jgi:hypothetical protein
VATVKELIAQENYTDMRLETTLLALLSLGTALSPAGAGQASEPKAYPSPMPQDIDFGTVLSTEGYPELRYAVPIIGWKHHPEEIHVTPAGGLVLPEPRRHPLSLQPALALGENVTPALLSPDEVTQQLVDGYKPGVRSEWFRGGLRIAQLAFGTLLEGEEVRTGRETLVGLSRFTIRNESRERVTGMFCVCLGEGARHQSMKRFHPVYPGVLRYSAPFVREENEAAAVCVLANSLGRLSFAPSTAAEKRRDEVVLNESLSTIRRPEFEIDFVRQGERVSLGGRDWPAGVDLYLEMSVAHSIPVGAEIELQGAGTRIIAGWLGRRGYASTTLPTVDYVAPGGASGPLPWRELKNLLPQGRGKLLLRPFGPGDGHPAKAQSWEPAVHLVAAGTTPGFLLRVLNPSENSLRIAFELKPGQERQVDLAVPYFPLQEPEATKLASLQVNERLKIFRMFWDHELNRNAEFVVPESALCNSYRACLAYNLLLVDRDPATGLLLLHPDATDYEHIWGGDSGVILQSMDRLGYFAETEAYTRIFLARQGMRRPEGDIRSEEGFLSGDARERWLSEDGFLLWAMAEHYQLSGDTAWLRVVAPRLIAAADWIIREREHNKELLNGEKPRHYGLLPRGRSTDLADWDYWYFNDAYSYLGLRNAAAVLPQAGFGAEVARIQRAADDYRECILASFDASINRQSSPPFVPLTPYKNELPTRDYLYRFWYSICSPIYMVEAGVFGPRDEKASWILDTLESKVLVSGLPRFSPDEIDPHYVYNQALTQLLRGETDKFIWDLYSLLAYGQSRETFATVEVVNYRLGGLGDNWDACRQPHMHSNSRLLAMLRIALVLEEAQNLHLMMGAPRGWLDDGKRVEVRKAPTYFGELNYTATSRVGSGEISFRIQPPQRHPANIVLHVRPPTRFGQVRSVTVDGKPWTCFGPEEVNLGVLKQEVTVNCTCK